MFDFSQADSIFWQLQQSPFSKYSSQFLLHLSDFASVFLESELVEQLIIDLFVIFLLSFQYLVNLSEVILYNLNILLNIIIEFWIQIFIRRLGFQRKGFNLLLLKFNNFLQLLGSSGQLFVRRFQSIKPPHNQLGLWVDIGFWIGIGFLKLLVHKSR